MANKLFFQIEFQGGADVIKELAQVELELNNVKNQINAAKKAGDQDLYKNLRVQQEDLKKSSAELRKEIKDQTKAFEAAKYPKDSLIGLEQEYAKLRIEIRGLSKDARDSAEGIAKIKLADSLKSQILEVESSIKDFKGNIGNYGSALGNVGDLLTGGLITGGITAAIAGVVSFGQESVAAFKESETAITGVATAIETTGKAAGFTVEQLAQEAENLMQNTIYDDDQILNDVTKQLLTFTNVTGETFLKAQKAALDLNTVLGDDLQGTAIKLGKALENPIQGVTALSKAGVTFTEQQKNQIKTLVESNKVQEAQAIILDEIANKYGNQAEALANTDTGKLAQLKNIFGELQEKVGGFLVAGLSKIAPIIGGIIDGISSGLTFLYDNVLEPVGSAFSRLFNVIFEGAGQSEILNKIMGYLGVILSSVSSILVSLIDRFTTSITWIRETAKEVPFLGKAFEFVKNQVIGFVEFLTSIPALLAAITKGFNQFVNNIKNFDFKTSAIDVGVNEFKRITEQKLVQETKKVEVKPSGARTPTNGLLPKEDKNDKEKKLTDDQLKRIQEIKDKIRELAAAEITNEFDRQIEAIRNKALKDIEKLEAEKKKLDEKIAKNGGKKTINDILESDLIAKETAEINKNLEKQKADIEKKRQEAFYSSKKQLEKLQSENLTIIKKANEELIKNELDTINNEFSNRTLEINIRYATDENLINEQFQKGIISEKEYNKQLALLNENKNSEILANEKDAANERLAIYDKELAVKLELLKVEKLNRLNSLQDNTANAKLKAEDDYNKGKIESYDELQKTLKAIDEKYNNESQSIELDTNIKEKAAINEITKLKLEANQKVLESDSQLSTAQIEANKKRAEILKEAISTGLDIAKQVSDTIFSAQSQTAENEKELRLKTLEDEYSKKIEAAKGNATLEAALKKDLEDKKLAIERQAFEENKKRQIAQALINGALAVTAILTVPDLTFGIVTAIKIAAAAATTALQVAAIKNTKFRYGGFTGSGFGQPDETGKKIAGYVHENEYVANEEQVRKYPKLFEYLNNDRLRKFRDGGFTSDFIPDVTGYSKVDYSASKPGVSFTDEQIDNIAERISQRTYEAVKKGSQEGSMSGTYLANTDTNRQAEREQNLVANTTF